MFTSFGTVSQFTGGGKQTSWQVWECYYEATETLVRCVVVFIRKNIYTQIPQNFLDQEFNENGKVAEFCKK